MFVYNPRISKAQQDKTNKITCAPSEDTDQSGHCSVSLSGQSLRWPHEETLGQYLPSFFAEFFRVISRRKLSAKKSDSYFSPRKTFVRAKGVS